MQWKIVEMLIRWYDKCCMNDVANRGVDLEGKNFSRKVQATTYLFSDNCLIVKHLLLFQNEFILFIVCHSF